METPELTLKDALQKINELGYTYIRVSYSGGGDSGDVDDPTFYDNKKDAESGTISGIDYTEIFKEYSRRKNICDPYMKPISDKIDIILNEIEDWWNNDGGFGHILIDTKTGEYFIDNNINYTETENYTHEGKLD